jgi:hypothetical protein
VESSKVVYKLPAEDTQRGHRMEGMTIDCKFKLWVALNGAGCILRIDPWKEISRLAVGSPPFELLSSRYMVCNMMFLFCFCFMKMLPAQRPVASAGQISTYSMLPL